MEQHKEKKPVVEKKPETLSRQLAALMYFESMKPEKRKEAASFESLTEAEQGPYINQVTKFLSCLDKLNLSAQPRRDRQKEREAQNQNLDLLTDEIEKFVRGIKTTKPGLFPCRELAARILQGSEKGRNGA